MPKTPCAKQCPQCPFRHDSVPGWLGSYTPASIFAQLWRSMPFFCHPTVDYEDPNWEAKAMRGGKLCLGSLRFANLIMAPKRVEAYPETDPDVLAGRLAVEGRTDLDVMKPIELARWHQEGKMTARMKELPKRRAAAVAAGFRDSSTPPLPL